MIFIFRSIFRYSSNNEIILLSSVLKANNVLKKDVRASFNRDSSIEIDSETSR